MQNNFFSSMRFALLLLLWAGLAFALRGPAPWIFWTTMVLLPLTVIVHAEVDFLKSRRGIRILAICFALFIVHIAWAWVRSQAYNPAEPGTYWRDDHNYFREAAALASAWSQGDYPEFWKKGSPPYLGTLHTGYHRPLSTVFLLFGPSTLAGLLINAVCVSLFPLLMALAARYLWESSASSSATAPVRKDPVLAAALLAALHPSQFYWAGYILKDVWVAFVFLVVMICLLGAWRRRSAPYALSSFLLLPYLFTVRIYTALSLIAGAACLPLLRMKTKNIIMVAAALALAIFLSCLYTTTGYHIYRQARDSFYALAPSASLSSISVLQQIVTGIPRLFLAPYAWLHVGPVTPMYGLYPGMWYLYLVGYPLAFAGLYKAVRENANTAVIPIAAFGFAALLFLTASYQGDASRQRFYLEYVVLLFAAYGLIYPNRWWIGGILAAEAAFAIGQLISLR